MARNLDIPPPIKDENKAEYILESAKLSEAEAWVAKHSKTSFETEENESVSATKHYITIKESQNTEKTLAQIFTLGFSISCLIWISLFAFLGEPCSVYCSGKEQWDVYEVIFANILSCGGSLFVASFDAIGKKRFRSIIFFFGFASGSFIGLFLGGSFV